MDFATYLKHDATALAAAVARGEATPAELLALAQARQAAVHERVNAVCRPMPQQALAQIESGALRGPFAGVPFLIKDAVQDFAGLPTSAGSRALQHQAALVHSSIVRRFLDAGLVIFGKTNTPELALKGVTDPHAFGRTNNPWNFAHVCGGSSGGAAAAVASGIVPMAAGNDGGGSIRIPAACCGLVGLKPSRGRVSVGPALGEVWYGASSDGVLSRSVRDTALALDVLAGPEPGDPFEIAPPAAPFVELVRQEVRKLRIGFSTASPIATPVHAESVAAVERTVALLQRLGHEVEAAAPAIDGTALAKSYLHIYFGQVGAAVARARAAGAREEQFELLTRLLATLGRSVSAAALTEQLLQWNAYARALGAFHRRFDLFLTPTLAHPPVVHGTGDPPPAQLAVLGVAHRAGLLALLARLGWVDSTVDQMAIDSLRYVPFTQLANLTGTPAISLPLHWSADGLPLGVQFIARFGDEATLLQLATQLEAAQPWFDRLPAWVRDDAGT